MCLAVQTVAVPNLVVYNADSKWNKCAIKVSSFKLDKSFHYIFAEICIEEKTSTGEKEKLSHGYIGTV